MAEETTRKAWHEQRQDDLRNLIWKLDICNCGSGTTWEIVKLLLQRADNFHRTDNNESFYDKADDASARWIEFGAKVLDLWDLLDHGTGIGGAWLTEEGKLLLKFLDDFGCDDDKWPDWAKSELD